MAMLVLPNEIEPASRANGKVSVSLMARRYLNLNFDEQQDSSHFAVVNQNSKFGWLNLVAEA
jgi:hypothetical protein